MCHLGQTVIAGDREMLHRQPAGRVSKGNPSLQKTHCMLSTSPLNTGAGPHSRQARGNCVYQVSSLIYSEKATATMFLLSRIQDSVQVQPQDLGKTPVDAIRVELEASYYDKVLPEMGLAGKQLGLTQLSASAVCCTSTNRPEQ